MKLSEAIAQKVKNLLIEHNYSQYYLVKNGGVPSSTISDVVNCRKKRVSTDTVFQICSTLNIKLSEFFDDPIFDEVDD